MDRDERMFDALYRTYYPVMRYFCLSKGRSETDADEITSEAFIRLWQKWEERRGFSDIDNKKWLYLTVKNIMLEHNRRAVASATVAWESAEHTLSTASEAHTVLEEEQYRYYIQQLETTLTEKELPLFRMAFLENRPYSEVMECLGINAVTLRSRIFRLRQKLAPYIRTLLADHHRT